MQTTNPTTQDNQTFLANQSDLSHLNQKEIPDPLLKNMIQNYQQEQKQESNSSNLFQLLQTLFVAMNYEECIILAMQNILSNFDQKIQYFWDRSIQKLKLENKLDTFIENNFTNLPLTTLEKKDHTFWFSWANTFLFKGDYQKSKQLFQKTIECFEKIVMNQSKFQTIQEMVKIYQNNCQHIYGNDINSDQQSLTSEFCDRNDSNESYLMLSEQLGFNQDFDNQSSSTAEEYLNQNQNQMCQNKGIVSLFNKDYLNPGQDQILTQKQISLYSNLQQYEKYLLSHFYRKVGLCYFFTDEYEQAHKFYETAIQIDPTNYHVYLSIGCLYRRQEELDKSMEFYQKAIDICPYYADAYNQLGEIMFEKQEREKAIEFYDKALSIDSLSINFYQNKGYCLKKMKNYQEALECYNLASSLDKTNSNIYNQQGECLFYLNQKTEALQKYEQAYNINQEDYNAVFNWAFCLSNIGRKEEAFEKYEIVLKMKPDYSLVALNQALCLVKLGKIEQSLAKFEQANALEPKHLKTIFNWAESLKRLQLNNLALTKYEEALLIKTDNQTTLRQWIRFMHTVYGTDFVMKRLKEVMCTTNLEDQQKWIQVFYHHKNDFQSIIFNTLQENKQIIQDQKKTFMKLSIVIRKIDSFIAFVQEQPKRKKQATKERTLSEIQHFRDQKLRRIYRKEIQNEILDFLTYLPQS